ncbi:hypothetical protein BofuT4_uP000280.1 [Botrytis cinerea T4]|uniref:Secreted protein n=1 Tax=Botryotinia fuckeliana (strain T4) TaxID=999810 RepID=G2YLT3_BOTF4|nr:hypothetical protein BofuT4_uP000280.1 [Botrytis cinerea T4]
MPRSLEPIAILLVSIITILLSQAIKKSSQTASHTLRNNRIIHPTPPIQHRLPSRYFLHPRCSK